MPVHSPWKDRFVAELAISPNVSRAARAVGVDRSGAYKAREDDPEFARRWDDAIQSAVDGVEEAAFQRAQADSDTLAIFLLKCHRKEVYGQNSQPTETRVVVEYHQDSSTEEAPPGTA